MKLSAVNRLRTREVALGTWLSLGSPVVAELAARSGMDWLLFDLEHGCGTEDGLLQNLHAIEASDAASVVRVGAPHPDLILRVLDRGADGVMVPHISSAEEARVCVRAMSYPPRGTRGFSRTVRAYQYGLTPPSEEGLSSGPFFMAQIENLEGVKKVKEIAAVDGVDLLFVGPADLNFDLTRRNETGVSYQECLAAVAQAAREAGKLCGILVRDEREIPDLKALGYTHLAVDSDIGILRRGYQKTRSLL